MQAKDKKEALLKTAEQMFSVHGYVGVSVEQITKNAGVAKGTFYIYFRSKDELYLSIVRNYKQEALNLLNSEVKNLPIDKRLELKFLKSIEKINNVPIIKEIFLENKKYYSPSVNPISLWKLNVDLLKILIKDESSKLNEGISVQDLAQINSILIVLLRYEKHCGKNCFWPFMKKFIKIIVTGLIKK